MTHPFEPNSWVAPHAPGYLRPHAVNNTLAQLNTIDLGTEAGPEHVAIGPGGKLYNTVESGRILRMQADGTEQEVFAQTGGWVLGFAKSRNPTIDQLANKPFMRKVTLRLPRAVWPIPKAYGHVMAFTEDGKVVTNLQDPSGQYLEIMGVTETAERLDIQSLHAQGLGWLPR